MTESLIHASGSPPPDTYENYVHKAFIEPIRSVTVIDDEYPTLQGLMEQYTSQETNSRWPQTNIEQLQLMIQMCREQDKAWAIDVYDGQNPLPNAESSFIQHLNHSDLLILDYHLENENDNGQRARNIIKGLAENNHFNLVIVHTKGMEGGLIKPVFEDILKDLVSLPNLKFPEASQIKGRFRAKEQSAVEKEIEEWFDDNDDDGVLRERILTPVGFSELLKFLEMDSYLTKVQCPQSPISGFQTDEVKKISEGTNLSPLYVNWWILSALAKNHQTTGVEANSVSNPKWKYESDINWIASGQVFLTVVKKEIDAQKINELPSKLLAALSSYDPSPMLLLMAKMRYELDERGMEEALNIISDSLAQAGWLYKILKDESPNNQIYNQSIDIHWDLISIATKKNLLQYAKGLIASLKLSEGDLKKVIKRFYTGKSLQDKNKAIAKLNAYTCSRNLSNHYLSTGHIICFDKDNQKEYWVCLTPACDMVASQGSDGWKKRIGEENLPFKAVKIHKVNNNAAINKVNHNNYIFIKTDEDTITPFEYPSSGNPDWETMFVKNGGLIGEIDKIIDIIRVSYDKSTSQLTLQNSDAKIISELRYEYALNLLHRFGSNQTRVGLDFTSELWN